VTRRSKHSSRAGSGVVPTSGGAGCGSGGERLTSLDGLRGLAALVVVVHHCALSLPVLAAQNQAPDRGARAWWLTYTPLHLAWAGGEAVLVFFVLSGLVLALPYLRAARPGTWAPYYAKRAVRLYVPVAAAVALTGVVVTLVPRTVHPGWSWWMNAHAVPVQLSTLVHDAALLDQTGWLNSALWSLRYEVWFSLLLPVFIVLTRQLTAPLWASVPAALWGTGWAVANGHELVSYMFVFAVGVLLAQRLGTLRSLAERIDRSGVAPAGWAALVGAGVLLLLSEWWLKVLVADWTLWLPIGRPGGVLGAAVLVLCFLHCPLLRALGNSRPVQWLGAVSFSLYLVHEPIVVSIATMTPATPRGVLVTLCTGIPLSLGAAVLFRHLVEQPSTRLSAAVGRGVRGLVVRPQAAPVDELPAVSPVTAQIPEQQPVLWPVTVADRRPNFVPPVEPRVPAPRAGGRAFPVPASVARPPVPSVRRPAHSAAV